jgi:uncharacterized protein YfaS (alpha-2-macroglobulin family)
MIKRAYLYLSFIAVLMGIFYSCGSKPEIFKVDPAYGKYVAAYSSGMVSRNAGIRVELNDETLKEIDREDPELLKDIFSFEPELEGNAVWVSDRVIEFVPDTTLPVSQFYTVNFDLDRVAKVNEGHELFRFQFATYTQHIYTEISGLTNYDDYNIEWQYLRGTITTTDDEDTTLLKQTLTVTCNGKTLPIRLEEGYEEHEYYFYADSVERTDEPGVVTVSWDGESINSLSKGKREIEVAPLGDFEVTRAKVKDEEDQFVELRFSEPIAADQDLNGFIRLEGVDKPTFSIERNVITVYMPNRMLGSKHLEVFPGIKNFRGHKMRNGYEQDLTFEEPKPRVRIKGKGNILPNSQGLIFPFESISLKAVDVRVFKVKESHVHHFLQVNELDGSEEMTRFGKVIIDKRIALDTDKSVNLKQWSKHVIDLSKLINPEPGAIYRVSIKFNRKYSLCNCPVRTEEEQEEQQEEEEANWNENLWDGYGYNDGYDGYEDYYDEYSACSDSYYQGKAVSRNILASDLGLVFKLDEDKTSHAFVSDMLTTDPIANALVEYYSYSKDLIASGKTDAQGMLQIKLTEKPFLMVAKRGEQRGYLKLRDGNANSLSKFDVSGERVQNGIKGFIYGERGVWRPGDSLYLTFMLGDKFKKLPDNYPVKFELQDPNGQVVYQVTKTKNVEGVYDFRTKTEVNAITGNYVAYAKVGNQSFFKSLKIESIKPNRLKIDFRLHPTNTADSAAYLNVRWLHGAIARNLRATVTVGYQPTKTTFAGFKGYVFDSPLRDFATNIETVYDGKLNEKGEARPKTRMQADKGAPGKLKASYVVKVFEESGDFSVDRFTSVYSPYKTYVGLNAPEMKDYDQTLETNKRHKFEVAVLDENGKLKDCDQLRVKVYKLKWRWWYERGEEDLMAYIARSGTLAVKDTIIDPKNGKGSFTFKANNDEYGRYLFTVTDPKGGHQTGQVIHFDWPYWNRGNRTENEQAKMLSFSSDKTSYVKGEKVKLSFPSPESGRALVSIENGQKVLEKFWIKTTKGETTHEFVATEKMAPASYIHVTMIQPHSKTKNDLPLRMYGVIPITVDDPETHLYPVINMPDVIKPETTASITVKEEHGKKMVYTLAVVDEGLLDLTRFGTPQPWNTFYAREALGVKTWDMYDDVIGAYAGRLDNLISIGGDGSEEPGSGPKANRFKPMVRYIGPFVLEAGKQKTHKIDVPNYVGSVRVMVVAHDNEGAYGNSEKQVFVRKPLMVLTTLPRVLGPGEEVNVPVTVFAMENHVHKVNLSIEGNQYFEVLDAKTRSIEFKENGDQVVNFRVRVKRMAGIGTIKVNATSGNETAKDEIEIDIRPSNPVVREIAAFTVEKGASMTAQLKYFGMLGTNKAVVEVSDVPAIGLEKRLDYLLSYPHGCLEQTTSSAFPQLYVGNLLDMDEKQKKTVTTNIQAAIQRLQGFQTSNGGFSYWPGESNDNEWATNYAGHFITEADAAGYKVPSSLMNNWISYQQNKAKNWSASRYAGRRETGELIQAYRLFVLALNKKPEIGAMNRLREKADLSVAAKWRLAATYHLAGQTEIAKKMITNLPTEVPAYKELSGSFGSTFRDKAMILEALSYMNEKSRAEVLVQEVAKDLRSERWMSTQETAYGLMAICAYTGKKNGATKVSYSYTLGGNETKQITSNSTISKTVFRDKDFSKKSTLKLVNKGETKLFVTVTTSGILTEGDKTARSTGIVMSARYFDMNGLPIKAERLTQGTEFQVQVTMRNPNKKSALRELALNQIFPSGWEIHNTRMDEMGFAVTARYQDFRDDRVFSYLDLAPGESRTVTIRLNAAYVGKFYLPSVYAEAMYDAKISALVPGKWIEVVKQQ